jgi:hypothetical protein
MAWYLAFTKSMLFYQTINPALPKEFQQLSPPIDDGEVSIDSYDSRLARMLQYISIFLRRPYTHCIKEVSDLSAGWKAPDCFIRCVCGERECGHEPRHLRECVSHGRWCEFDEFVELYDTFWEEDHEGISYGSVQIKLLELVGEVTRAIR